MTTAGKRALAASTEDTTAEILMAACESNLPAICKPLKSLNLSIRQVCQPAGTCAGTHQSANACLEEAVGLKCRLMPHLRQGLGSYQRLAFYLHIISASRGPSQPEQSEFILEGGKWHTK